MHAPDGFLNAGTAVATGAVSLGAVGVALRQTRDVLQDRQIPLAGVAAAFIFAAQMVNFPVAAGTTGHLLGGALAAVLLGPAMGAVVVTVVVVIQALAFADGGLTALGYNILNMAVVTAIGGWAVFVLLRRVMPKTVNGLSLAAGLAAATSVVMSSMAFSIEWLFGATAPVSFAKVFGAMVTVHLLIGIGEGIITALAVRSVLSVRPDLVKGAEGMDLEPAGRKRSLRALTIGGLAVAFVIATVVAQFAVDDPDGLERVATDTGFAESGRDSTLSDTLFSDYATQGLGNEALSLAVAGATGTLITLAVGWGLFAIVRDRRRPARSPV
ncbi:MAG TPA: energy-coupling factor ABC transporter permease [Acidimicrobiia bacterium]|nr:energy-coupling factor ABC transporter permease [Acidimicrobiia bacterium]